jgi:hypothetical protein
MQRWALLGGASATCLATGYVLASYRQNPVLRVRPGSLLVWRAAFNLGFGLTVIANDIHYFINDNFPSQECLDKVASQLDVDCDPLAGEDCSGTVCVCGSVERCQWMSFWVQFFLFGSETFYFAISLDLYFNLTRSPFARYPLPLSSPSTYRHQVRASPISRGRYTSSLRWSAEYVDLSSKPCPLSGARYPAAPASSGLPTKPSNNTPPCKIHTVDMWRILQGCAASPKSTAPQYSSSAASRRPSSPHWRWSALTKMPSNPGRR